MAVLNDCTVNVRVTSGEPVYCEECDLYNPSHYFVHAYLDEKCKATINTKSSHRRREIPIHGKPKNLNANNDCKYFKVKPEPKPYFKFVWVVKHGFTIPLWGNLKFCVNISEKRELEVSK